MRWLLMLGNPWCMASMMLLVVLLVTAAALTASGRRRYKREAARLRQPRMHELAASAPLEALYGLSERLAHVQRQLAPSSKDADWLAQFRLSLQQTIDQVYQALAATRGVERELLLTQLDGEVAELDRIVSERLAAQLSRTTDRAALHMQLEQLERVLPVNHRHN